MNRRTRTLLAIAMSTALIAPAALAQSKAERKDTGNTTSQAAKDMPSPARAADAVDAPVAPAATLPTGKDQAKQKDTDKETPPTAQGADHAAGHSSVVQRDVWARLDVDADGRISAAEADADATFDGDFDAMDADDDGFVSDTEYRTSAKMDAAQGATKAASHSSVVQRGTWSRLDVDGDGRISATEADADAGIDGSFQAIDSNSDGFITDAEFRAHAKATSKP